LFCHSESISESQKGNPDSHIVDLDPETTHETSSGHGSGWPSLFQGMVQDDQIEKKLFLYSIKG